MATLRVINSKSECVAEALTPQSFVDFKRRCANEGVGRIALIATLDCGEDSLTRVSSSGDSRGRTITLVS